jgi:hypothetical protein
MSDLIEAVIATQEKRQAAALQSYRRLVDSLLSDEAKKALSPDKVEAILHDAGKSVADLKKDIGIATRRNQLRQVIDSAAGADDEVAEVGRLLAEENSRFATLEREHRNISVELVARREAAVGRIAAAESAKRELSDLFDDDDRQAVVQAGRDIDAAAAEKRNAERALHHIESQRGAPAEIVEATKERLAAAEDAAVAAVDRQNELLARASER